MKSACAAGLLVVLVSIPRFAVSEVAIGVALDGHVALLRGDVRGDYWDLSLTFSWY